MDCEGIYFIHVPRTGGTFLNVALQKICNAAGIPYIYGDHSCMHYPPENYLVVTSVRNPISLLRSLYFCWDSRGFGQVSQTFGSYEEFAAYFCIFSDFSFLAHRGDVWYNTFESFHLAHDKKGDVTPQRIESGDVAHTSPMGLAYFSRPYPWLSCSREILENKEYMKGYFEWKSSAFEDYHHRIMPPNALDLKGGRATPWKANGTYEDNKLWYDIMRTFSEGTWTDNMLEYYGITALDIMSNPDALRNYWYYTSDLWCCLYNPLHQKFLPDIVLRQERLVEGITCLAEILGVNDIDFSIIPKNPTRYQDTILESLKPETDMMIFDLLRPAFEMFNYNMSGTCNDDLMILTIDDWKLKPQYRFNFVPNSDSFLVNKWSV